MERDYAAIIAAMREKARRSDFPEEKKALETKAKELEEKYDVKEPVPEYETDPTDWIRQNYRMSRDEFVRDFFSTYPVPPEHQFLVVITGEDQKWRRSYLWPNDGSPIMNPDHTWTDTEQ